MSKPSPIFEDLSQPILFKDRRVLLDGPAELSWLRPAGSRVAFLIAMEEKPNK